MVEVVGDDVAGLAGHIGARVGSLAQAGEVLVSSTVKDLVAGSGFTFEDRGTHVLKGVPDELARLRSEPIGRDCTRRVTVEAPIPPVPTASAS